MRIKKHGRCYQKEEPIKTERFECKECGCEFTAKDDEYYVDCGSNSYWNGISSITYSYSTTITDWLVCSCPECHKIVKKSRTRETNITAPYTYTAVTSNSTSACKSKEEIDGTYSTSINAEWTSADSLDGAYSTTAILDEALTFKE